ncbi:carbamoyltransferase [Candidatus Gracilibacteria bacterium]|nr:carbamoyltransferase [Candidatus Gracilibacteria bacterium]
MKIIGISAFFHDSASALIQDGEIISAVQEERFTRKKQDAKFPENSIKWILKKNNLSINKIDFFVFYEKPFLKFERLLENFLSEVPFGIENFFTAIPVWIKEKLFLKRILIQNLFEIYAENFLNEVKNIFENKKNISDEEKIFFEELKNFLNGKKKFQDYKKFFGNKKNQKFLKNGKNFLDEKEFYKNFSQKIKFSTHHESHSASAFYPSPLEDAAILTIDGVGEWTTTSIAHGKGKKINFLQDIKYPHSLGLFYSAITYFLGFKVNSGEYKVMGLAPYGEEKGVEKFYKLMKENLIDVKKDGSFRLNLKYFSYLRGLRMTNENLEKLFGVQKRIPEKNLEQIHMDIAGALQKLTEEIMIKLAKTTKKITGSKNLCLAGGVALNCVGNGKILEEGIFENIWIQPASGDAGGAVGGALAFYFSQKNTIRNLQKGEDKMKGAYLGPQSSEKEILKTIKKFGAKFKKMDDEKLFDKISEELKNGKVIGWHQGKMEFGPRSLGNRSIIGDARNPEMQKKMNLKIKFRESFRPFAPAVLEEDVEKYFKINTKSSYMLLVADVQEKIRKKISENEKKLFGIEKLNIPKSEIPAVTHVDYSARIQTVSKKTNPKFHKLISKFKEKTGSSILINTSFNVRGEPIVCTADDSYKCFMRTGMDYLVIENFVFKKSEQPDFGDDEKWKEEFVLD